MTDRELDESGTFDFVFCVIVGLLTYWAAIALTGPLMWIAVAVGCYFSFCAGYTFYLRLRLRKLIERKRYE